MSEISSHSKEKNIIDLKIVQSIVCKTEQVFKKQQFIIDFPQENKIMFTQYKSITKNKSFKE